MVRLGPETQEPTGPAGPQKMEMYLFHLSITSGDLSTIGFPPHPPRGAWGLTPCQVSPVPLNPKW